MAKLHQKDDQDMNHEDSLAKTKNFWKDAEVFMPQHKVLISKERVRVINSILNGYTFHPTRDY